MPTLTEHAPDGAVRVHDGWEANRVRFGTYTEPRGRSARSPPKLGVFTEGRDGAFFAELHAVDSLGFRLEVVGADFEVYLNGRKVDVGGAEPAVEGDLLRIAGHRFIVGHVPAFPRDEVEAGFLAALRARPGDDEPRLVYGDWLEERGDFAHAELLRIELAFRHTAPDDPGLPDLAARFHEVAKDIASPVWRMLVARPLVEACDLAMELSCPKRWEALAPTDRDDVRRCDACAKDVVYCSSLKKAREVAGRGGCIALDPAVARYPGDLEPPTMVLGIPRVP